MRRLTRTKIVSTIGPSSSSEERLAMLLDAGVDVFRFNFSHGTHEEHAERFRIVRSLEANLGRSIGILADMQGPKLRVGSFAAGSVELMTEAAFRLDLNADPGDGARVNLPHPEIFAALKPGDALLLDDGKLRLEVTDCGADYAETRVTVGGRLSNHKGVNLPNVHLDISPLTAKDRLDVEFALELGATFIGLSFVQRPEDLTEARELVGGRARILAKLEKPSAIQHLERIIDLSDAIMVARGDLGVEMPTEDVPVLQRRIVRACRRAGKPVIVATQMLESMVKSPTPTRAEASDVANAVYEGADAVMLSAETAAGDFPVEAVKIMERIIMRAERDPAYHKGLHMEETVREATEADAITAAARSAAETIGAAAIITYTRSGGATLRCVRERPAVPILALTTEEGIARMLSLSWGVHPVFVGMSRTFREFIARAEQVAIAERFAESGSKLVFLTGFPVEATVNTLRISEVK
ncbi:MAG: pyruvate kinase [Rhodospirillales bacterium]|nr:pyruvate kinase [Rhodospirillales bacterium]